MLQASRPSVTVLGATSFMFAIMILASANASAGVSGVWNSTVTGEGYVDSTYPASFHWDVELTLDSDGTGHWSGTCSRVTDVKSGWESAYDVVGNSDDSEVTYTVSGSTVHLTVVDDGVTLTLTQSGNRLYGSGEYYTDGSGTVSWTMDVTGGSGGGGGGGDGGVGGFNIDNLATSTPALIAAGVAAAIGITASVLPASASASYSAHYSLPATPTPINTGAHLYPADAFRWANPGEYPAGYPYPKGTMATMTCPSCGMPTLPPFATGWFCTNALCPSRGGNAQGRLVHQYNQAEWGKPR